MNSQEIEETEEFNQKESWLLEAEAI